jgi:peptidyl-dipeptidase Dcp
MKSVIPLTLFTALVLATAGCSETDTSQVAAIAPETPTDTAMTTTPVDNNPFFTESPLYFHYPQFDKIENAHYIPAFELGMEEQLAEIDEIVNQANAPTLDNTLIPMEKSGQILNRVSRVFFSMSGANTNDEMEKIRSEMAPRLSAHNDQILLNDKLFARIQALYDQRDSLELDPESYRLIEETYKDFIRAGAQLSAADKEILKAMNAELASLQTTFSQNVLNEVNASAVVVDNRAELAGLSDSEIEAAAKAAETREMEGKYVIALLNTSQQPPLTSLEDRALRQRIMEASLARGSHGGEFDNREILTRIVKIRAERAELMGYENHAAYSLENQTARTTTAVNEMLASLAPPAVANTEREATDIQAIIDAEGGDFKVESYDWDFYTEKVRKERYDFDAAQLRPYFELNNVLEKGLFYAAGQVFGLTFKERHDLPVYQEDVRVFEVFDADGSTLALFILDPYARPSKRGGAWMNAYVSQSNLMGTRPIVANHLNITRPTSDDEPTLLTFDEVTTMFHEFGHGLHGMFSNVNYPTFAGTSVPRDFVEFPSQVNEMWSMWPEVLKNYAVHYQTGEVMPTELLDKVLATQKFNQGYITTEYLAASLLDQAWHQLKPDEVPDAQGLLDFEATALQTAGVALETVPPRYRSTYFSHIISGYSAGYYSYIWAEVLDADTVEWFKQNGGMTRANGDRLRRMVLSRGGSTDAMTLYRNFRGAEPDIQALLKRRGLDSVQEKG